MIRIRTALQKDLKEVSMLVESGAEDGALLPRTRKELNALAKKGNIFAAFDGERLVGIAMLDFYSRRMAELRSVYVAREYRKRGIGRQLILRAVGRARSLGVKELMTITLKENKDWFVGQGFGEDPHGFKVALFREP